MNENKRNFNKLIFLVLNCPNFEAMSKPQLERIKTVLTNGHTILVQSIFFVFLNSPYRKIVDVNLAVELSDKF